MSIGGTISRDALLRALDACHGEQVAVEVSTQYTANSHPVIMVAGTFARWEPEDEAKLVDRWFVAEILEAAPRCFSVYPPTREKTDLPAVVVVPADIDHATRVSFDAVSFRTATTVVKIERTSHVV